MRSLHDITGMQRILNDDIFENGWDAGVEGALLALTWVLNTNPRQDDLILAHLLERPEDERRRDWIHRGGDPNDWDIPTHKTREP